MADALVLCGGSQGVPRQGERTLRLDVSSDAPEDRRIRFDPESITSSLVDDLPDPLADAVELGAYVFCADRLVRRCSSDSRSIGSEWQRRLRFKIPVRCTALWNSRDVTDALIDALTFLSGDDLEFTFVPAERTMSLEPHLGFRDPNAHRIKPSRTILFSGGLDSLAGVVEDVLGAGQSAVLVTHKSASGIAHRQDELAEAISNRAAPKQVYYAPIWVGRGTAEPMEFSQRLRSFLFATLGMAYAWMFGNRAVYLYENGITSFNLPLAGHVIGTRASRTTHPTVLRRFSRLFSLLLDDPVSFENPFVWKTKADVTRTIMAHACADMIGMTTSCAEVRDLQMTGAQCGSCSQCIERRYAVLAADHDEPITSYRTDMFLGAHEDARDLAMIQGHLIRARKLASMSQHAFLANYGEVLRALPDFPGPPDQVAQEIFELHRRYGAEVAEVFNQQSARHSSLDAILSMPATSLIALVRQPASTLPAFRDPIENEAPASEQAQRVATDASALRIIFAIEEKQKRIVFGGGVSLSGRSYLFFSILAEQFCEDLAGGKKKPAHTYVPTKTLMGRLKMNDVSLRQLVRRMRRKLELEFEANSGFTLDEQDVIQSINWGGYRLNPYLVVTEPTQVDMPRTSRLSGKSVTTLVPSA